MIDREPVGKHHKHDPFAPFIFPALSLGQLPPSSQGTPRAAYQISWLKEFE